MGFQSTRPMRGATRAPSNQRDSWHVSIHAPHAGRDAWISVWCSLQRGFNPRAPCGARQSRRCSHIQTACFNPRAPCGARLVARIRATLNVSFNPRAPCGARPRPWDDAGGKRRFNPRAPCGARQRYCSDCAKEAWFQSTRPMRGATVEYARVPVITRVSIHAPHAGRDLNARKEDKSNVVSIHAPHAGRDGA